MYEAIENQENLRIASRWRKFLALANILAIGIAVILTFIGILFLHSQETNQYTIGLLNQFGFWGLVLNELLRFAWISFLFFLPKLVKSTPLPPHAPIGSVFFSLSLLLATLATNVLDAVHDVLSILFGTNTPVPTVGQNLLIVLAFLVLVPLSFLWKKRKAKM